MKDNVLKFDEREISINEMIEHIEFYSKKAEEGMKLFSDGNKKDAMGILREIRKILKEEYSYYKKVNVQKYINSNKYYMIYYNGVFQAYVKQMYPNEYKWLHSNLYDVRDYISNYDMRIFFK
ncbi:hypothetical protein ACFO6R_08405 [Eubacterium multiforme]|uniref:Uncharacterized protein n=1 Tax=Eubacterium multiforme TaxID=83339 RepID=A0ABT9UUR6_9FIRM|nr:hypothetical protein [Eubacterium multiforme]MDQ0150024.1 hypothetical protein [Eubacterium multiforme]